MAWEVRYKDSALKELAKLPESVRRRIREVVVGLQENPFPHGVKKMQGSVDYWRVRVGDYRVIYELFDEQLVVIVVKIGHRGDVYR